MARGCPSDRTCEIWPATIVSCQFLIKKRRFTLKRKYSIFKRSSCVDPFCVRVEEWEILLWSKFCWDERNGFERFHSIDSIRNMLYLRIHYFKYFQFIIFEFFSKLKRFEVSIKITNYIYINERDDLKFMIDNSCLSFHQFDNRMQNLTIFDIIM